jgi:hypothetical protein
MIVPDIELIVQRSTEHDSHKVAREHQHHNIYQILQSVLRTHRILGNQRSLSLSLSVSLSLSHAQHTSGLYVVGTQIAAVEQQAYWTLLLLGPLEEQERYQYQQVQHKQQLGQAIA